jgi:hypothetical protein
VRFQARCQALELNIQLLYREIVFPIDTSLSIKNFHKLYQL